MIHIPSNEKSNFTTVNETYDLLKPTDYMQQVGNEFLLYRPSSNAPLREMRIRSFKPIVSKEISNAERLNATIDIFPVINGYDSSTKTASTIYKPTYQLYNEKDGVRLPVSAAQYIIEFTGYLDKFVKDINDAVSGYCEDFDWNGTFVFSDPEGTDLNYLINDEGTQMTIKDYYNSHMPLTKAVVPNKPFTKMNADLTTFNLSFNLNKYVLTFIIEVNIDPLDIFNTSTFIQTFNALNNLKQSWVISNNDCTTRSTNFGQNLIKAKFLHNGLTLTLSSPFMNNLSQKIYTDYTEARVTYKRMDVTPSSNYFPVSIMDKNNHKISLDYLNTIYDQIIIEVDYIYEQL